MRCIDCEYIVAYRLIPSCLCPSDVEQEKKEIKQVIVAELAKHKIDQASKEKWRLQNIRDALLRDEVIKPEKDLAKAAEALAEVEDYKRRRVLQIAEAQVNSFVILNIIILNTAV